jgi:hypothetical protein
MYLHMQQHPYIFGDQALANCFWAMGKLQLTPPVEVVQPLLLRAQRRLHIYKPQHMSMLLWGLAKLRFRPEETWLQVS